MYEGGTFHIDIQIGASYPFEPPKMKFLTKVWPVSYTHLTLPTKA